MRVSCLGKTIQLHMSGYMTGAKTIHLQTNKNKQKMRNAVAIEALYQIIDVNVSVKFVLITLHVIDTCRQEMLVCL